MLVEKPFTMNAREAQEIVALAEAKGLVVLEAMWSRFLPHMVRIREIIAEGTLGEVRKVIASHNQNLPKDPAHRLNDPALGGGALLDLGIYPVSFAFDVLGTPDTIRASASMTATGVDRQTAAIFEYAQGQQALVDCELDAAGANRAVVIGTEGWIDIESTWYNPTPFTCLIRTEMLWRGSTSPSRAGGCSTRRPSWNAWSGKAPLPVPLFRRARAWR